MFKNILIPISSEHYSKEVLERGAYLAAKFKSTVSLFYIIEEKTITQTDKLSDSYRTSYERVVTSKEIIKEQMQTADNIIFADAKFYFQNEGIPVDGKVMKGEFSNVVKNIISKSNFDLILIGYERECLLNYRLLDQVNIPIWVEAKCGDHSILAVCSNLAPNQKVPEISVKLSQIFGWDLHMLYIVDTQDNVEVDINGQRSGKKPLNELIKKGERFVDEMRNKGIQISLVKGTLEKETIKGAEKIGANLVIVGREQKKNTTLGLPLKNLKKKLTEKCRYSILFFN